MQTHETHTHRRPYATACAQVLPASLTAYMNTMLCLCVCVCVCACVCVQVYDKPYDASLCLLDTVDVLGWLSVERAEDPWRADTDMETETHTHTDTCGHNDAKAQTDQTTNAEAPASADNSAPAPKVRIASPLTHLHTHTHTDRHTHTHTHNTHIVSRRIPLGRFVCSLTWVGWAGTALCVCVCVRACVGSSNPRCGHSSQPAPLHPRSPIHPYPSPTSCSRHRSRSRCCTSSATARCCACTEPGGGAWQGVAAA